MSRSLLRIVIAAVTTALLAENSGAQASPGTTTATTPKVYDVRDFFRRPDRSRFQIAPDGRHVAFLSKNAGRLNVFVQALDASGAPTGEAKAITSESARDLASYFWKGDAHIVYSKDFGGDENFHVLSVPIDRSGTAKDLTPYEGVVGRIVDDLEDDDAHLLISNNRRDRKVFDVFRVDVNTGAETLVAENPGTITSWLTDHAGRLRAAQITDGVTSSLLYRDDETQPFRTLVTTDFRETLNPYFFTFDDRRLYVSSNRGRDRNAFFEFDPKTSKETKLVYENNDVDVGSLTYSRKRKVLTEARYTDWKPERRILDPQTAAIYADLAKKLPGHEVVLGSTTRDESRYIVAAYNDRSRGASYIYDVKKKALAKLADNTPWLAEADMAAMKPISYQSRDGLVIHGYLTLPVGKAPKDLPMVVNPHGGPWARDTWGFNPQVQLLANRGYAVLQMNFRGSTGYGRKFWEASFKQWGRTMQDDVTDGVEAMKAQGIADPKRIAIYGASYGGYVVLAGITSTPDLYAAAIDYVGVANLTTFMNTLPPYWEAQRRQLYEMVGDPATDREQLLATSPVNFVDRIKVPLFVAQGARDPRVNKTESDQIVDGLKKRGVTVEYMVKDNEGHGFRNEENQYDFYEAMEKFLARNLKP